MTFGLETLRAKTLAVIGVLVIAPVIFVWLTSPFEAAMARELRDDLNRAREQSADITRIEAASGDYESIARRFRVWVRVIDVSTGKVTVSMDRSRPTLRERILFAARDLPSLTAWDSGQPPLPQRPEVVFAIDEGEAGGCSSPRGAQMLVCWAAVVVKQPGKPDQLVHLVGSYSSGTGGLFGEDSQIAELMLVISIMAIVLGGWLASRITRPLQHLQRQVLERTQAPVSTHPIDPGEDTDFAALAEAFNELLGALDDRTSANEQFMADMAHEIKNPVAAIRAASESLARGEDVKAARAERLSNILRDSARRLDGVVTNFLELARAESGLPQVEREPIQVSELVANVLSAYAEDERYEGVELVVQAGDNITVNASAEHIERALRNLVENALSFARRRVQVKVRKRSDGGVDISVRDDGKGILPADVERVFDRFFTRRDDGGGTGLGLAMTRAICEAHGGDIEVDSSVGVGTSFIMTFPA
jgi:two-component system sensor histidine kinase ChvG